MRFPTIPDNGITMEYWQSLNDKQKSRLFALIFAEYVKREGISNEEKLKTIEQIERALEKK
jgi:hypothetical protein